MSEVFLPEFFSALIRLSYHGWPTQSRCSVRRHRCLLCNYDQGDRLNHIAGYRIVREAFVRFGVCSAAEYRAESFLLCHWQHSHGENLIISAVLVASLEDAKQTPAWQQHVVQFWPTM